MKKSILALGAAALVGGLGFAGTAQAVAFFGDGGNDNHNIVAPYDKDAHGTAAQATALALNPGGIGHVLFVPYYTAQGTMSTLLNITNTDLVNGKAVKVRFRSAANSDDVMDFTVMLSPGDVWSAAVANVNGVATLNTSDNSCTLPQSVNAPFNPLRLDQSLSTDAQNLLLNEGYIEILNMADVPPRLWAEGADPGVDTPVYTATTNPLFTTIKHKNSVPPCDQTILNSTLGLLSAPNWGTRQDAFDAGLGAPTGQLMSSFAVVTLDKVATYGGEATAIRAVAADGTTPARGNIIYSPQLQDDFGHAATISAYTGDPLLRSPEPASAGTSLINPLWYDLPDMSTPLTVPNAVAFGGATQLGDVVAPLTQVDTMLLGALSKGNVINDWVADSPNGFETDWVVSQPTRRYYAAVDYKSGNIVWNADMKNDAGTVTGNANAPTTDLNRYGKGVLSTQKVTSREGLSLGTYACMQLTWSGFDREENTNVIAGGTSLSPGAVVLNLNCGEVYTITFGHQWSSVLQAQITNQWVDTSKLGVAGWGVVSLPGALPSVGFAATSATWNGGNMGYTIPHRWN